MSAELQKATQQAMILEKALKRATTDKGISYYSLTSELNKAGTSASKLTATLAAGGKDFAASLNAANKALSLADRSVISLNSKIKEMNRVLVQSFKFTAAQTFLQGISTAAQEAYQWVYELDKTITNIGVVTGYTGDQLDKVTQNAIAGAKELRIAANDYAEGALIFYQQGLGDDQVAQRVEITAKAARAAGSSLESMSSQLTAIWNTYKMTGDEMERAASVGAKMAGDTAVDFADIAEAMQTAAAPAEQMGVSYNSLAAIIATVGDTTQQSASVIGNAFKTIFSRFQQLKSEGTDGEVTLNRVSSQLQELGVNVLDSAGNLRSLDTVIAEVGNQWDSWSSKQQLAIAQLVGGTRQYGQFLTLMNNFDKYQDLLTSANLEDGSTLEQQYQSSLDSIESHAENAGEAWRRAFGSLIDEDAIKTVYSLLEGIGNTLGTIFDTLGGAKGLLLGAGAILAKQIVPAASNAAKSMALMWSNRNTEGRKENINKEYKANQDVLNSKIDQAENDEVKSSLQLQKQKNEFSHRTAIINEEINEKLKNASGEYKIQLEYQRQQLEVAEDLKQASLDRLSNLSKELANTQSLISAEEQRAKQEQAKAQNRVAQLSTKRDDAMSRVEAFESQGDPGVFNRENVDILRSMTEADLETLEVDPKQVQEYLEAIKEAERYTRLLEEAQEDLAESNIDVEYAGKISNIEKGFKDLAKDIADFRTKGADVVDFDSIKRKAEELKGSIMDQFGDMDLDELGLTDQINELDAALGNMSSENAESISAVIQKLEDLAIQAGVSTDRIRDTVGEVSDAIGDETRADRLQGSAGNLEPSVNPDEESAGSKVDYQGIVEGFMEVTGAAGAAASAVGGFISVLNDADASPIEKITAAFTALIAVGSMVPMLSSGILKLAAACGVEAAAAEGATLKTVFLGEAGKSAFATMLPVLGPIIVAIGAVAAGVAALDYYFNSMTAEAKLEKMNQAAQDLATSADEAKQKADGLKSTIESYNSAVSTLNNCTQGTEEWKEALQQTNDAALQVIDSLTAMGNVDLSNLYQRDKETGMLSLDQEELKKVQEQADALANQKDYAAQMAQLSASQQANSVKAKDLANEYDRGSDALSIGGSAAAGAATGALIGSVIPVVGTAIGAVTGAVVGAVATGVPAAISRDLQDEEVGKKIEENIEELVTLDDNQLKNKLEELGMSVSNLSDTEFAALRSQLDSLAQSTQAAQEKLELIAGLAVDEQLGDKYSGEAKDIVSKQVAADQTRLTDEWTNFMNDNFSKISDGSDEDRKKLVDAFNTAMGTNYTAAGNFSQGTDDNRVFAFRNEVTGEIETFTKEYIASTIAAQQALEGLEVSAQEAETMLKNLSVTGEDGEIDEGATQAVRDFISTGNLEGATKGEFNTIKQGVENAGGAQQYLESIGFTPEVAKQYAADFEAALDIDWDSVTAKLPESFKKAEDLSLSQAQGFGDTYHKIIGIAGEQAGQEYENMMNSILEGVAPKDQNAARDLLANIDWTQWDAATQAANQMRELGYEIDTSSEAWKTFTNNMRDTFNSIPDLNSLLDQISQVKSIAEGLDLGSIISEEDYNTLVNFNSELGRYFAILSDGSAQLIGDPLDFMQAIREGEQQNIRDSIEAYKQQAKELEGVSGTQNYVGEDGKNYYDSGNVNTQLDYLQSSGYDSAQIDTWRQDLEDGKSTVEVINAIGAAFDELGVSADTANAQMQNAMNSLAMTADSAQERMAMLESGEINEDAYNLAATQAMNQEKWEGFDQEDIEMVEDYAKHLQSVAEESDLVSDELKNNEEAAEDVALVTTKMNKGIDKLADGFEDWSDVLNESDESSQEYFEAMTNMKDAMSDVLNISEDFLSDDFITENMEDIEKAANGDAEAIDRLRAAALEDIVMNFELNGDMTNQELWTKVQGLQDELNALFPNGIEVGATIDTSQLGSGEAQFIQHLNELIAASGMTTEQVNAMLSGMGFTANFASEPQEVWHKEPDEVTTHVRKVSKGTSTSPQGEDVEEYDIITTTETKPGKMVKGEVDAYSMETSEPGTVAIPKIESITKAPTGAMNNYSGSNSGGGSPGGGGGKGGGGGSGSKPTKKKAEKRDSMKVEDRYSTVKAAIDDVQREMDKFSANQDDMWGGAKLNALKKYNKELHKQAGYYRELVEQAKNYLENEDKPDATNARQAAANALGAGLIGIEYYEEGYVKNRTEIINQLDDLLQAKYDEYYNAAMAYDAAVDAGTATEAQSEAVDNLKTEYEDTEKVVNEYVESLDQIDETAKEAEEALQKLVEAIREEIANKVEEITYKIELQVEMNDLELEQIERTIEHLGDVGVLTGKKFGLLSQSFRESQESANLAVQGIRQLEGMINNLNTAAGQEQFIKVYGQEAWDEYAASGVLPEEAIDGIKGYISDLTSAIDDMYSKMEDLFDTYLDALEMFADKFDQIADKLSHNIDKLDTYQEILEFSGQGWTAQGQTARNTIAQARVSTTQANLQLATSEYETYKSQYDDWMSEVEKFQDEHGKDIANYDEATAAAWNKIEETRQELYSKMNEAEGEIYSNMQELVSNIADAIEVGAEVITEQISDSLGGMFYDFDSMMDEYSQREELRLFFLEDYDKTYQLESLLRDIDDVMDDVTDPGRLQEYQSLIDEINAANEEGVQITQNDVDLLKAKFELQKAQDAYEEQMNAKNTMRLARDASGNWNYVYSQDQSQTEDAAQALADAQYNYDKLLHEVRDESSELWLQTQQEFFQWQQEIDQSRLQWDTQYREQVERTTKYYLELTQRYADQVDKYNNLLGESYSSTTLGVVTGYDKMQDAQFDYSEKHKEYNSKLEQNTVQWEGVMKEECEKVGLDYNNLAKDVTSAASNIMAENTALESDVKSLQQTANTALTNMQKNVWSNVNSMISAIKALEAELQRAIQLLQTLTNKSLMSGYDENTDYTDYLHTDYAAYTAAGGKMGMSEWLDMYHSQDIWERMGAGADRGIYAGKEYDEAKDLIIDSYNPDATYINGNQYNFGEGTSGKYLNDWSNIKDQEADLDYDNLEEVIVKGKRASGGIVNEHGLYELAEDGTEFVLNPDDTKNILSAVKTMREVVRMKMSGLDSALGSKANEVVKKTVVNKDIQQVDQQVHIDATFPNVSVAKEIEEAFSNLVNQAVQYASAQKNSRQG